MLQYIYICVRDIVSSSEKSSSPRRRIRSPNAAAFGTGAFERPARARHPCGARARTRAARCSGGGGHILLVPARASERAQENTTPPLDHTTTMDMRRQPQYLYIDVHDNTTLTGRLPSTLTEYIDPCFAPHHTPCNCTRPWNQRPQRSICGRLDNGFQTRLEANLPWSK